MFIRNF
jgi:hypothetical protein